MSLGPWRLIVQVKHLILVLYQLLRLLGLKALNSFLESVVQDLAAMARTPIGVERVGDVGIWSRCSGRVLNVLVSGRLVTSGSHVLVESGARLHGAVGRCPAYVSSPMIPLDGVERRLI